MEKNKLLLEKEKMVLCKMIKCGFCKLKRLPVLKLTKLPGLQISCVDSRAPRGSWNVTASVSRRWCCRAWLRGRTPVANNYSKRSDPDVEGAPLRVQAGGSWEFSSSGGEGDSGTTRYRAEEEIRLCSTFRETCKSTLEHVATHTYTVLFYCHHHHRTYECMEGNGSNGGSVLFFNLSPPLCLSA